MENMIILINDMKEWHKLFNSLLKTKNKNKKMFIAKLYNELTNKINIELLNNLSEEEIKNYYLKYNENINYFLSKLKEIYLDDEIDLYFNIIVPKKVARKLIF
jgi:hypothetical protein